MDLILTVLTEVATSLRLTTWLELMALVIVLMLLSSPGVIATIVGAGSKLGIFLHIKSEKQAAGEAEAS